MESAATYALLVTACFVVPSVLLTRAPVLLLGDHGLWTRLSARLDQISPRADDDELAALTAWAVRRSQALARNLERLARIVATDEAMSATRQIANRIAYAQVLRDVQTMPEPAWPDLPPDLGGPQGTPVTLPGRPDVELLDVGWSWRGAR